MSKRILLAEESETIRKIAEQLLRQNGFEVLSMNSGQKALEVLNFTSPDLILLASDMKFKGDTTLFDKLQSDPKTAQFSVLLLANENETDLPLPPEAIITKPFNPKDFIERINLFSGKSSTPPSNSQNPLASTEVEDEFLDAALGLDQIDVTGSEVLNQSVSVKVNKIPSVEKMIGFEHKKENTDQVSDSGKVESLMLSEDVTDIKHANQFKPVTPDEITGTGKLEILDDQFGIASTNLDEETEEDVDHDYNWFLDELSSDAPEKAQSAPKKASNDSQSLKFEDTSEFIDPITPVQNKSESEKSKSVDKFIDEFKKEVEKFGSDETESLTINESGQKLSESGSVLHWTDSVEKITPQQIDLFKKEFVKELADKLAILIAEKIDSDKLLHLLKQEIINKSKKL